MSKRTFSRKTISRRTFSRRTITRRSFYIPQVQAWINQLSAPLPSASYLSAVNTMVAGMITDGNWYELDKFCIFATEQQQHARICLVNPTSTAITEVNSPTWTAGQGYTGNGSNMYLNLNFNGRTQSIKYQRDSGCVGAYLRTNVNDGGVEIGHQDTSSFTYILPRLTNLQWARINVNPAVTSANTDSRGMFASVRTTSLLYGGYKNGASVSSNSSASMDIPNNNMYAMAWNSNGVTTNFSSRQISMIYIGSGAMNQATFYTRFQTFATTIGFNV